MCLPIYKRQILAGVGLVVVDNFDDIDRLERIVPPGHRQACLVRVIPGVTASTYAAVATGHAGSKFGLLPEDARVAIDRIRASRVLRCDGVHTHVGSQLMQVDQLAAAVAPIAELGTFDVYDLGGGLGVRYTYDDAAPTLDDYADAMIGRARDLLPADASQQDVLAAVDRLNAEVQKALLVPAVKTRLEEMGGEAKGSTPDEMKAMVASQTQKWIQVVADAKIPKQ